MDGQQLAALGIVVLTAALMFWSWRRRRRALTSGVCEGCACATGASPAKPTIVFRARRQPAGSALRDLKGGRT